MAVFTCTQCGHSRAVDDKHVGKNASCPKCKNQGMVDLDTDFNQPAPTFVQQETLQRKVIHATAGPLGIRCETWVDFRRHLNEQSSLKVQWWTVVDESLPVRFAEPSGLLIHNIANDYPLSLEYRTRPDIVCVKDGVTALEVKYMTFNVWGEHVNTLAAVRVKDMKPEQCVAFKWSWDLFSETDAEEYCASLAFVSRVRLAAGGDRVADTDFVVREARRLCDSVTDADLQPKMRRKEA